MSWNGSCIDRFEQNVSEMSAHSAGAAAKDIGELEGPGSWHVCESSLEAADDA